MGRGSVFGGRHHTDGKRISSLLSCFSTYTELKKNRLPSGLFRADECALHRLCSRKEKEKEENPCTSVGQLWCRRSRRKRGRPTCGKPRVLKGKIGRITWYYSLSLLFFPLRFFVQHSVRTESNFQSGLSLSAESRKRKSRPAAAATGRMSTCGSASMPCQVTWAPDIKRYAAGAPFRHH